MEHSLSPSRVAHHVGSRVRARRVELGLSENETAAAISVTVEDLLEAEAGRANFTAAEIYQLCGLLRVTVSWFFEGLV